ncbi:MAG TPA: arsenate reductase ArsC [Candidatus Acidoferrales bacterium]|jgi:arsenate reductase|nr:arsenate reductase ArsC [Candidatus Acidoferrales bacterium]
MGKPYNVLFLCTGNSARSIMAEAILTWKGHPYFVGFSAGSYPSGIVRPEALQQIKASGILLENFRSKSWDEFVKPDAPQMDFVITVCDNAAGEVCPVWPGQPITAHWGVNDPAALKGSPAEIERAFREAFVILDRRISLFLSLPFSTLSQLAIKKEVGRIGQR